MKHVTIPQLVGAAYVRADASDVNAILKGLLKTVEDFKETHAEQIKGVNAKFDDVVTREKLDKVNSHITTLQTAIDELNAKAAAVGMGNNTADRVVDKEYTTAFAQHFRRGDVQASLNKGTNPEGGYTAPVEWDRTVTDKLILVSPMRQVCNSIEISTAGFSKLFNLRGTASGWVGETAARPETATPTFGSMTYLPGEMYANPAATQPMLDDGLIDLETWLAGEVETEFSYQENLAFVSGSGANNRPNGILTYVTGGANAAAHPFGDIKTVASGNAAALTADGIVSLVHALPDIFTANARFIMNRNTLEKVRLLKDGQGNFLWQPSYAAGQPQTILGYAVTEVPAMPNVAAGAKPMLFGDFKRGYLIVDRQGIRVLRDPFSNKPYVMFYTTKRVGGGLLNPEVLKALNIA